MKCPSCNEETTLELVNTIGDHNDGLVYCNYCGKLIANFNYVI